MSFNSFQLIIKGKKNPIISFLLGRKLPERSQNYKEVKRVEEEKTVVNPNYPNCPSCGQKATSPGSHSVMVKTFQGKWVPIGWWSGWYCSNCSIIFCHHPSCELKWCRKAKKLQPSFYDLL